jgi:uncharacterized membrane protein
MKRALVVAAVLGLAMVTERGADAQVVDVVTAPNYHMIGTGLFTFAVPYTVSALVGATSNVDADRYLFVPLVGPWVDLGQRPGCPITAPSCNSETAARVGLVFDGLFQDIGALMVISGLLWRHELIVRRVAHVQISPWFGPTGSGLAVNGSF